MNFLCIANRASSALISLLLAFSLSVSAQPGADEDDFLLMTIPSIIAASQKQVDPTPLGAINPLDKIKELGGDWLFSYLDLDEEFRFDTSTAKINPKDIDIATIDGAEYANSFSSFFANNVYGAYNAADDIYGVFHQWGPPTYDSGSMFFFRAASSNTPGFDCHFFTDADGKIDDYYAGHGGSAPCEPLTKTKASSQARSQSAQALRYTDPNQRNATKYQIVLERRAVQAASSRSASLSADNPMTNAYQGIYEFLKQNLAKDPQ